MRPLTHILFIIGGIAAPIGITFWSTADSGPRSAAHYAAVEQKAMTTRDVIEGFEKLGVDDHHPDQATLKFVSPDVVDHDPNVKGDRQSIIDYLKSRNWATGVPKRTISHIVIDGDLAVVHHHIVRNPGEKGIAAVDVFRVKDGRIVEHWDVLQPVPETSINPHAMF